MQGTITKENESRSCTEEYSLESVDYCHYPTGCNDGYNDVNENYENKIDTESCHHDTYDNQENKLEREHYYDHETDGYDNSGGGHRNCNLEREDRYDHETEGYENSGAGDGHKNCDCDKDDQKYAYEKYDHVEREQKYEQNECGFDEDCNH